MLSLGSIAFERYRLERELGEFEERKVFLAIDTKLNRSVSLSVVELPKELRGSARAHVVRMLMREAQVAGGVQHPNIASIFDVGEGEGYFFTAMELVKGSTLRQQARLGQVSWRQIVQWLTDAAMGLEAAHQKGVAHGSFQPENVLIREDGVVKIIGFGSGGVNDWTSVTFRNETREMRPSKLTPYVAPELHEGSFITEKSDMFSWGVTVFECLLGNLPWKGRGGDCKQPLPMSEKLELRTVIPKSLENVISRTLNLDPDERYQTFTELVQELTPWGMARPANSSARIRLPSMARSRSAKPLIQNDIPTVAMEKALAETEEFVHADGGGIPQPKRTSSIPAPGDTPDEHEKVFHPPTVVPPSLDTAFRKRVLMGMVAGLVIAIVMGSAIVARTWNPSPQRSLIANSSQKVEKTVDISPSSSAVTIMNWPRATSCLGNSTSYYRQGCKSLHDGNWEQAYRLFEKAEKEDPTCPEVRLRLSIIGQAFLPPVKSKQLYEKALHLRNRLRERDRQLLDAFEPILEKIPADRVAFSEALARLTEKYPNDSELAFLAAYHCQDKPPEIRQKWAKRAVTLDPAYSDAWEVLGIVWAEMGDSKESLQAFNQCLQLAPQSVDCLNKRIFHNSQSGKCDQVFNDANSWVKMHPQTALGYHFLIDSMIGLGKPNSEVDPIFKAYWNNLEGEDSKEKPLNDRALQAYWQNEIPGVLVHLDQLKVQSNINPNLEAHLWPAWLEAEILWEQGKATQAGEVAFAFLNKRRAWVRNTSHDFEWFLMSDFELRLVALAHQSGLLSEKALQTEIKAWQEREQKKAVLNSWIRWSFSRALFAESPKQAEEVVRHLPEPWLNRDGKLYPFHPNTTGAAPFAWVGHALLLAGDAEQAIPYLKMAASVCSSFRSPFVFQRSVLWLANAYEQAKRPKDACEALAMVPSKQSVSGSQLRTLREIVHQRKKLSCPAP
jgi:eukaryotic-like serine/threonine-protein kinase